LISGLSAVNPITGLPEKLTYRMADPVTEKILHMVTPADPNRTPTFTLFGDDNFYFETIGSPTAVEGAGFAWNHGDDQPEIARTFVAIAGPGVTNLGVTTPSQFFTDHVDVRPTIMLLTGLTDDYSHDGRSILELINPTVLPTALGAHRPTALRLGQALKAIDAPFGALDQAALKVSTFALATGNVSDDGLYDFLEFLIASWDARRNAIADPIKDALEGAEFHGDPINEFQAAQLIARANELVDEAQFWSFIF
jgi:hypothetical protein